MGEQGEEAACKEQVQQNSMLPILPILQWPGSVQSVKSVSMPTICARCEAALILDQPPRQTI